MRSAIRRIIVGSSIFVSICAISTSGYMIAGWSFLDAIYQVVITVFGVGFGEINTMGPELRIFTMFVIVSGYTAVGYIVGAFLQLITEGEIRKAMGARRMMRDIQALENHTIIGGYGRMGQVLAKRLAESKQPFVVIDNNDDRLQTAEAMGYLVFLGNATDEATLEAVGIERAKVMATVLPDDATNVFITLTARSMNPSLIILARGEFPSTEKKLRRAGADHVVLPAEIGALRMSHIITHPAALDILDRNDGGSTLTEMLSQLEIQIDELAITPNSDLIGTSVGTMEIRGNRNFIVVAVRRANGSLIIRPGVDIFLHEGDTVVVMGHRGDIPKFAAMHALDRQMQYRGARQRRSKGR
jgi:voltage-gated potassium channel